MGRKGRNNNKEPNAKSGAQPHVSMTLREKSSGKKHVNVNAKTMCKVDHLKSIAAWAAAEASVPSLGAFLGERLASTTESLDLRADSSLFVCERCESVLQPGSNCTVRIESNKSKISRSKKSNLATQNNVVYTCHFCSNRNSMRGTPKGYLKKLCPPKARKQQSKLDTVKSGVDEGHGLTKSDAEVKRIDEIIALPVADGQTTEMSSPVTTGGLSLLDSKRRKKRCSTVKKMAEQETSLGLSGADEEKDGRCSSKRRRKTWTSLKEIAGNESSKKLSNLSVPFFI